MTEQAPLVVTDPEIVQGIAHELGIGHDKAKVQFLLIQMEKHFQARRASGVHYAQELEFARKKRGAGRAA